VVVFASGGDNITPPQQALNWIVDVYGSEEEIKLHGQTIVYILHQDIGHLGIFVSGKVAQKEHYEINEAIDFIDVLPPGLYEMVIEKMPEGAGDRPEDRYLSRFEPRTIADIRQLDDGQKDANSLPRSKLVSELNTRFYEAFIGPWVRMMVTEPLAKTLRELQPLRIQYRLLSDENPFMWPLRMLAPMVAKHRRPVADDNPFKTAEKRVSDRRGRPAQPSSRPPRPDAGDAVQGDLRTQGIGRLHVHRRGPGNRQVRAHRSIQARTGRTRFGHRAGQGAHGRRRVRRRLGANRRDLDAGRGRYQRT
jgi:hypothetical protein